jgi:hypothetical protein
MATKVIVGTSWTSLVDITTKSLSFDLANLMKHLFILVILSFMDIILVKLEEFLGLGMEKIKGKIDFAQEG